RLTHQFAGLSAHDNRFTLLRQKIRKVLEFLERAEHVRGSVCAPSSANMLTQGSPEFQQSAASFPMVVPARHEVSVSVASGCPPFNNDGENPAHTLWTERQAKSHRCPQIRRSPSPPSPTKPPTARLPSSRWPPWRLWASNTTAPVL